MTTEEIQNLTKKDIIALLEICRRGMRFQDGFWFMKVEDIWGIASWLFFDYTIEQVSDTEAIFQVKNCLAQTGRLRVGRNIFACRRVDEGYFTNFIQVIDPRIKIECEFSPPDKYFTDLWCRWRFYIETK